MSLRVEGYIDRGSATRTRWSFTPNAAWKGRRTYHVVADNLLEDIAGNHLDRAFDSRIFFSKPRNRRRPQRPHHWCLSASANISGQWDRLYRSKPEFRPSCCERSCTRLVSGNRPPSRYARHSCNVLRSRCLGRVRSGVSVIRPEESVSIQESARFETVRSPHARRDEREFIPLGRVSLT